MFKKVNFFLVGLIFSFLTSNTALANLIQLDEANSSQMLDYEILVLRAELATQSENLEDFALNFQQLQNYAAPETFIERYKNLEAYFNQEVKSQLAGRGVFSSIEKVENIVLLLPLSGDFGIVGQAMQEFLERNLAGKRIHTLDIDIYDSMAELWGLVQMFEPDLIIGPLRQHQAQELAKYNKHIPNITFASLENPEQYPNVLARASSKSATEKFFGNVFKILNPSETTWLMDKSQEAKEQYALVMDLVSQPDKSLVLQKADLSQGVDKALAEAIGAQEALKRKNWLQHVVQNSLEFEGYVRQDKSLIFILSDQLHAEQLAPLIKYHGLKTPVVWLPTSLPSIEMFYNNLDNWQETYALLPAHFLFQLTEIPPQNPDEYQVGLFYALAEVAIDLIEQANMPKPFQLNTQLGKVEVHSDGYYLMPRLVKLVKNKFVYTELSEMYP